jgi:hypothetical protein
MANEVSLNLHKAIEQAAKSNYQTFTKLEEAIREAYRGGISDDDIRYRAAVTICEATKKAFGLNTKYNVALLTGEKRRAAKAGR